MGWDPTWCWASTRRRRHRAGRGPAEAAHGVAADVRHSLYLSGTIGIGAGIVQDGSLVRGGTGFAGEVGHMPIGDPAADRRQRRRARGGRRWHPRRAVEPGHELGIHAAALGAAEDALSDVYAGTLVL